MADSDGRDETGSPSGKTRVKDSQLEDHNQQPATINNPNESCEEEEEKEEAREHQEAECTLQETNRESREEEAGKRDAATGEEKEEINVDAEKPLLHGEMIKKRKTDHEDESGVVTLTLVGADLPGAQTGKAAMPMMMGRLGSEVGLGGGGVSISAAANLRSVPRVYKCKYCAWTTITGRAMGGHVKRHRYAVKRAVAAAFASLDQRAAVDRAAEEDPPEADQEPPPRPAGQDEGGRDEENQNQKPAAVSNPIANSEEEEEAREHQEAPLPPPTSMITSEPEAASFHPPAPPVAQASDNDHGAVGRFDLNELPAVEDEDEQHAVIQPVDNIAAQPQEASGDDKDAHHEPEDSPAALDRPV